MILPLRGVAAVVVAGSSNEKVAVGLGEGFKSATEAVVPVASPVAVAVAASSGDDAGGTDQGVIAAAAGGDIATADCDDGIVATACGVIAATTTAPASFDGETPAACGVGTPISLIAVAPADFWLTLRNFLLLLSLVLLPSL